MVQFVDPARLRRLDLGTPAENQMSTVFAGIVIWTVAGQHPTPSLDVTPDQDAGNGPDQPGDPSEDLTIPVMKEG